MLCFFLVAIWNVEITSANGLMGVKWKMMVKREELNNGLTVLLKPDNKVPVVFVELLVRAGSITEGQKMGSGLSHYFEHMVGRRTKSGKNMYDEIARMGGIEQNAFTSYDRTGYHFGIPKDKIRDALIVFADAIFNSVFDEEESRREIDVIYKEMNRCDDNPLWQIRERTYKSVYLRSPYSYPIIGYRNLFSELTKKDMLNYYEKMYSPDNMLIGIAGDFETDEMISIVRDVFGDFERKNLEPISIPKEPEQIAPRYNFKHHAVQATRINLAYPGAEPLSEDEFALVVLENLIESPLYSFVRNLKEKNMLVYELEAFNASETMEHGVFGIQVALESKHWEKVLAILKSEIQKLKVNLVSDEIIKKIVDRICFLEVVRAEQRLKGHLSDLLSAEFEQSYLLQNQFIMGIRNVTPEKIRLVAKKYLIEKKSNWIGLVPKGDKLSVFENSFFEKKKLFEGQEKSRVTKKTLTSGVNFVFEHDASSKMVAFVASIQGGSIYETKATEGLWNLLSKMLLRGTESRTYVQIQDAIEELGGEFYIDVGDHQVIFKFLVLKDDFSLAFDLFQDILLNSNFSMEQLTRAKMEVVAEIKACFESLEIMGFQNSAKARYKEHPYGFQKAGKLHTIDSISRDLLLKTFKNFFNPQNLIVSVSGNIDNIEIERLLNALPVKKDWKDIQVQSVERLSNKIIQESFIDDEKSQSLIVLSFDAPTYEVSQNDIFALEVLSGIMGGGMSGRLFKDIRDNEGLVYWTHAALKIQELNGQFQFSAATTPENRKRVIDLFMKHLEKLVRFGVEETELKMTIARLEAQGMVQNYSMFRRSMLRLYGVELKLGESFFLDDFYKGIKQVNNQDIRRVVDRYLKNKHYVLSITESKRQ